MAKQKVPFAVIVATIVIARGSAESIAQTIELQPIAPPVPGTEHLLVPVDQTVADLTAISTSLQKVEFGLGAPSAFSQLYRVGGESGMLLRADGGLYALFHESVYANYQGEAIPLVPAGTQFYIGRAALEAALQGPFPARDEPEGRIAPTRVQAMIAPPLIDTTSRAAARRTPSLENQELLQAAPAQPQYDEQRRSLNVPALPQAEPESGAMSIVTDAIYRRARVHFLLQQAAAASDPRATAPPADQAALGRSESSSK